MGGHASSATTGRRQRTKGCPCPTPPRGVKPAQAKKKQQPPCRSATTTVRAGELGWLPQQPRAKATVAHKATMLPAAVPKHSTQGPGVPGRERVSGQSHMCTRVVRDHCSTWHVCAADMKGRAACAAGTHGCVVWRMRCGALPPSCHREKETGSLGNHLCTSKPFTEPTACSYVFFHI